MKLQIMSDLHLEFYGDLGESFARNVPVLGDVLVLAGDVMKASSYTHVEMTLGWFCDRFRDVVYVPGNHEYYGSDPLDVQADLMSCTAAYRNLHVLMGGRPGATVIGNQRFIGGTLWFPYTHQEEKYRHGMTDFSVIRNFFPWVYEEHERDLRHLAEEVQEGDVVVTHHLPYNLSIALQYAGHPLNRFFVATDAEPIVEDGRAKLWIHGHTHTSFDYHVNATRVVANPRGYPGERGPSFRPDLVIDI